ncbi:MAG: DUF2652 domain-containing protein, partial [Saprospiraceae bacterium]|nr:DUF2652 domain-containing protein [Saprospiraceae bacterium]
MANADTPSAQPTLIFIPDITGFTEFVHNTEISHSQHIIEELLEEIIDANEIGLQISEIEGDAILFYLSGTAPTAAELLAQIQRMYVRFHGHLKKYETRRICQCGACSVAHNLKLKFVLHHGPLAEKHVKQYTKLFGKDLIVAHRLLKNSIDQKEYALFSHDLLHACSAWVDLKQAAWEAPREGEETYDAGRVQYCYLGLEPLAAHVPEPRIEDYGIKGANAKMMEIERGINASLEVVFDVVSDVSFRHHWIPGIKDSDKLTGKIVREGSTHRCLVTDTEKDPFFYSHS